MIHKFDQLDEMNVANGFNDFDKLNDMNDLSCCGFSDSYRSTTESSNLLCIIYSAYMLHKSLLE